MSDLQNSQSSFVSPLLPTFSHSCSHPVAVRLLMSKNVSVMRVMSGGLQESTLGVWGIPKAIWQLRPKSTVQQGTLWATVKQDVSLLYWVIWLCLLLFSFLHACHSCCLAMQRERNALYSPVISLHLCCYFMKQLFVALCMMMSACVFFFPSTSLGPLWLCFFLWLWLHPVSSQECPPSPAYDMV